MFTFYVETYLVGSSKGAQTVYNLTSKCVIRYTLTQGIIHPKPCTGRASKNAKNNKAVLLVRWTSGLGLQKPKGKRSIESRSAKKY